MKSNPIGEIVQINRYPVKSFAGESLNEIQLESYGLYGDRSHAFVDNTKEDWYRYITARQIPGMLGYQAELDTGAILNPEYPQVKITGPDGRIYRWDNQLLQEIQSLSNQPIAQERYSSKSQELMAFDEGSILIVTDRSLKKIEQQWGKRMDSRRFRANFVLSLYEDLEDDESPFIGKRLIIGDSELSVSMLCERCEIITIDPATFERDPSLLKQVNKSMNLQFGMYADVEKTGMIHAGDQVYIAEQL